MRLTSAITNVSVINVVSCYMFYVYVMLCIIRSCDVRSFMYIGMFSPVVMYLNLFIDTESPKLDETT